MELNLKPSNRWMQKAIRPLFWMCTVLLLCNAACVNKIDDDDEIPPDALEANSSLTVITRAGETGTIISYPVNLYIFGSDNKCVGKQELKSTEDKISFALPAGDYQILAFAGATKDVYNLPDIEKATPKSVISLINEGATHANLMTSSSSVSLGEKDENTTTLVLNRKVMQISSVVLKNLPTDITAVSLSVGPVYKDILLNGSYSIGTTEQHSMKLEQQSSDKATWSVPSPVYLLPGEGTATVTITLTNAEGKVKTYTFPSTTTGLKANYRMAIEGSYTADKTISLSGIVTGAVWDGTEEIKFGFGDSNSDEEGSGNTPGGGENPGSGENPGGEEIGNIPQAGTAYKGCYVLSVTDATSTGATLTLLSPKEVADVNKNDVATAITKCAVDGLTGWRLPNETEVEAIFNNYRNNQTGNDVLTGVLSGTAIDVKAYFCSDSGKVKTFNTGATSFATTTFGVSTATVRAVSILRITVPSTK